MSRRQLALWVVAVALLGGCGDGSTSRGTNGPSSGVDDRDEMSQPTNDALARYDAAVLAAGGSQALVPVEQVLTSRFGDWEPANEENNSAALMSGQVLAISPLPAAPQPTGVVTWYSGGTHTVPLIPADEALSQLKKEGTGRCRPDCVPLEVTGARLTTVVILTTRGAATIPAWEFALKGTAVRATRVAVASSAMVRVTPPYGDPAKKVGGIAISLATTTTSSRQLTVAFGGAQGPASDTCGADYRAEVFESLNAVVVNVLTSALGPGGACLGFGSQRTITVELARPLGERAVLEAQWGLPVVVTITA